MSWLVPNALKVLVDREDGVAVISLGCQELAHATVTSQTFKQAGVSVAVCQPNRDTDEPGHLQASHRLPRTRAETVPWTKMHQDNQVYLYGHCTETNEQAWCRVVSKKVPQQLWVTHVRQSSVVCHASPIN